LKEYCRKIINIEVIFVQADLEDSHGIEFYKQNGGILEEVLDFDFKIKK
jgi:hypothetical protein